MMKSLLVTLILAGTTLCYGGSIHFPELSVIKVTQSSLKKYNKNLSTQLLESTKFNKKFNQDFKAYLSQNHIQSFLKADLIGDTIYFKNGALVTKMKVLSIDSIYKITLLLQGHQVTFDEHLGFKKNYEQFKSVIMGSEHAWWEVFIGVAEAATASKEDSPEIASALNASAWFTSDLETKGEKLCEQNEAEVKETRSHLYGLTDDTLLSDIRDLVQFQEKNITPLVISGKGQSLEAAGMSRASDIEKCIYELAMRRRNVIESQAENHMDYGFTCFVNPNVVGTGWVLLDKRILDSNDYVSYDQSYSNMEKKYSRASGSFLECNDDEICKKKCENIGMQCRQEYLLSKFKSTKCPQESSGVAAAGSATAQ